MNSVYENRKLYSGKPYSKCLIILSVIFCIEHLLILNLPKKQKQKVLFKTQVTHMCTEDMLFIGIGIFFITRDLT